MYKDEEYLLGGKGWRVGIWTWGLWCLCKRVHCGWRGCSEHKSSTSWGLIHSNLISLDWFEELNVISKVKSSKNKSCPNYEMVHCIFHLPNGWGYVDFTNPWSRICGDCVNLTIANVKMWWNDSDSVWMDILRWFDDGNNYGDPKLVWWISARMNRTLSL